MQMELKALQHRVGITFLVVTHDQEEALVMSDRIAVMQGGRLQQVGPPGEIYDRPANRFVASFVGNSNLLPARVVACEGGRATFDAESGLRLHAAATGLAPGDRVDVLLRPEQLQPDTAPGGTLPAIDGVLEDSVFVGADRHLRVVTAGGDRLTALARHVAGGGKPWEPGAAVRLTYDPAGVHVLRSGRA
jgi:spermidine/putrescine transport system ATP-binding protein